MEVIAKLQDLITKDEKMLRPRLLTNINIMNPNELALHQPAVSADEIERTTVGPIQTTNFQTEPPHYGATLLVNSNGDDSVEKVFEFNLIFHNYNF